MVIILKNLNKKLKRLINKLKEDTKKQDPYIKKCKKYNKDITFIDDVEIMFEPIDVSAKTINGIIILNQKLLKDGDWDDIMKYIIHEVTHCFQQEAGLVNEQVEKDKYLDDDNEKEAFRAQLEYMDTHETNEEIQEYLENLLDHHNVKRHQRKEYIKELTKDI